MDKSTEIDGNSDNSPKTEEELLQSLKGLFPVPVITSEYPVSEADTDDEEE